MTSRFDPGVISLVDQEQAKLVTQVEGRWPILAELVSERNSPWHDGASIIITDLLEHRDEFLIRLLAWDQWLHGTPTP